MKPRGEDVAGAVRKWSTEGIEKASSLRYDLGKFFFGVASATIGFLATIEKLALAPALDATLLTSFAFCFGSVLVALSMVLPRRSHLRADDDLYDKYEMDVRRSLRLVRAWFVVWFFGFTVGIAAVVPD